MVIVVRCRHAHAEPATCDDDGQREILENLSKSRTAPQREVTRAKALLYAGEGLAKTAIAVRLEVSPASVVAWRSRFGEEGVATRPGAAGPGA